MPLSHLLTVYFISLLLLLLPSFGLARLFQKVGIPTWKAFVPFYNTWTMQEAARKPKHWVFWQLIPVVGWFITLGIYIEWVKLFGRFSFGDHTLAALLATFYFPYLASKRDVRFIGPEGVKAYQKAPWREWVDAAVFAVVAATLIRTFVFEAYTIPSSSMEKTLLVNDFLFVSKFSYGPRLPSTPLSIPFVHNYLPGTGIKSYSTLLKLPYTRWFPSSVKRGDVVVFNFPAGDTVINLPDFQSARPYYDEIRTLGRGNDAAGRVLLTQQSDLFPLAVHPPDKSDNYIKRCVAVPGDSVEVRDNVVYANGVREITPPNSLVYYTVTTNGQRLDALSLKEEYGIDHEKGEFQQTQNPFVYHLLLSEKGRADFVQKGYKVVPTQNLPGATPVFPYAGQLNWSRDNFGPLWVPSKGAVLQLTTGNYPLYERAIRVYESNEFETREGKFYLNGKEVTSYQFKMDYYFMMGDNRQGSQDSRYWGFVPEDRIVGKASLVWFSYENGPRWSRLFNLVK